MTEESTIATATAPPEPTRPAAGDPPALVVTVPPPARRAGGSPGGLRRAAADFWLRALMRTARDTPWLARRARAFFVRSTWTFSPSVRAGTLANAGRILGPRAGARERKALARRVVGSFYDFVCDMGANRRLSVQQLAGLVSATEGAENFRSAVARGRGVVIVTAHLGSFETSVAALRTRVERVHVVFKRDQQPVFEAMRSEQRRRLGVIEAPIDDGWPVWLRLHNALQRNEIVLMQGDRLMPGQRGERVPFLGGHVELPTGPAKLALAAGATILPAFAIREPAGRIRLVIDEPIFVETRPEGGPLESIVRQIATAIERQVALHPEQWLILHAAWCEDRKTPAGARGRAG